MRRLKEKIKEGDLLKCINFIDKSKEARHLKTMTRQKAKLNTLINKKQGEKSAERSGCSNKRQSSMYMHSRKYMYKAMTKMATQIRSLGHMKKKRGMSMKRSRESG